MRYAMLVLVLGCRGGVTRRDPAAGSGSAGSSSPATLAIPRTGSFALPAEYTRCTTDAECTFTALGCCDTTPVLTSRAAEVHAALEAAGRPYCPAKTACGPGANGTWEGAPGACIAGSCGKPSVTPSGALTIPPVGPIVLPVSHAACAGDADCVLVALGCAHETPVNRMHADEVRGALAASGRAPGPIDDACGPGNGGSWDGVAASCVDKRCDYPVALFPIGKTGAVALPWSFTWCAADADCTVVSLGCADELAVHRAYASIVHRSLQVSGRGYRAPKDACGPGPDGTMNGVAGECRNHACQIPKWP